MTREQPCIHFAEGDNIPPASLEDGEEIWWMAHYWCDCGWQSHDSHDILPDDGRELAEKHSAETGHPFCEAES